MVRIYNPTNSPIADFDGNRDLKLSAGDVVDFSTKEADFLLKKFSWLIEVDDYIPYEFRSDNFAEVEKFKDTWKKFGNNIGLLRNKRSNKFLVIGNRRYEIPNTETREVLGYDRNKFMLDEDLLDSLEVGENVTDVIESRLIRSSDDHAPVYAVFTSPTYEKRHIPDQKTRMALRRSRKEIEELSKEEFEAIRTGKPLRSVSKWDVRPKQQNIKAEERSTTVINAKSSQFHFGKGDNVRRDKKISGESFWSKFFWYFVVALLVVVLGGLILYNIFGVGKTEEIIQKDPTSQNTENNLATTTLNVSDLLSKALSLETVVERQDFLTKYVGDHVYGKGVVEQISRWGDNEFLVDIKVDRTTISCSQDAGEENEKRLLLLKNKTVNFSGVFTYVNIFEHGLEIKECQIF